MALFSGEGTKHLSASINNLSEEGGCTIFLLRGLVLFLFILGCWIGERIATTCYNCDYERNKQRAKEYHNTQ